MQFPSRDELPTLILLFVASAALVFGAVMLAIALVTP